MFLLLFIILMSFVKYNNIFSVYQKLKFTSSSIRWWKCHLDPLTCSPTKIQLHFAIHMKIKNINPLGSPCNIFCNFLCALLSSLHFWIDNIRLQHYFPSHSLSGPLILTCEYVCKAVAYPWILFGGEFNKFSWGQRERESGGGSSLVSGSGGSCNLVQEISFHIVKFS